MKLINIGFGNVVSANRLIAIVSPESAPVKRIITEAREKGLLIDAAIYAAAFVISSAFFMRISHPLVATAVFTAVCTVLIFIGSVVFG